LDSGQPFTFTLGAGEVIEGWDRGVEGMRIGGKRELIIPSQMGYGKAGAPPEIPPDAILNFEVQLLDVEH
jgi:FKBP-type peptidyl-prolyl cis-trans isomerase